MSGSGPPKVVVTGFRRFPGVADNPAQALVEALQAAPELLPEGAECRLLETAYAAISPALDAILADPPAALVLTGYSALAHGFKLERRASDLCSPDFADMRGFRPAPRSGEAVDLRESGVDLAALEAALLAEGFACGQSDDAGQYVCNSTYHNALARIARDALPTRALFVHLPAIAETRLAETSACAMELDEMARGVALIARLLAAD